MPILEVVRPFHLLGAHDVHFLLNASIGTVLDSLLVPGPSLVSCWLARLAVNHSECRFLLELVGLSQ